MSVVGLTGYAGSGKDTAAEALIEIGYTRLAFADPMREGLLGINPWVCVDPSSHVGPPAQFQRLRRIIERMGWDRAKRAYPDIRALQQNYGTEGGRHIHGDTCWTDALKRKMLPGRNYVVTDVRFPNEVGLIHTLGGKVVRIRRHGVAAVNAHVSDTGIDALQVDYELNNDAGIDDLHNRLRGLVA